MSGLILWAVLFGLACCLKHWSTRHGASPSTARQVGVSGNRSPVSQGKRWEQDVPYAECFEEDDL